MKAKIITTDLCRNVLWQESEAAFGAGDAGHRVCLYPQAEYQTFEGFGGAFTEAAGWNYNQLSAADKAAFTEAYFGKSGLGYALGRTHMQSCDFALSNYACTEAGDKTLADFSMERDEQYLLPLIRDAQKAAGRPIGLLLSPWSPPAFMKTNGDMNHGGKLLPKYYNAWAECIVRYVAEYRREGCDVRMLSVQNEPAAVQTWDSCIYSGEEEAKLAACIVRKLKAAGQARPEILVWDHNKELLVPRAEAAMRPARSRGAVDGFAFHWYTGDHFEAVSLAGELFPRKKLYFTEGCVEYSRFGGMTDLQKAEMYAHDILGNLAAGIHGSIDWNLLLDEKGGPNHVGNFCEAPIMRTAAGGLEKKGSYYYIGQFSRCIRPGAKRIAFSRWCGGVEVCAFRNSDAALAVVLLNRTGEMLPVSLGAAEDACLSLQVAPHTIQSVLISE